jgi:hypothetical protein
VRGIEGGLFGVHRPGGCVNTRPADVDFGLLHVYLDPREISSPIAGSPGLAAQAARL